MPDISKIPTAASLQQQMTILNSAIAILNTPGASVTYLTATPPASEDTTNPAVPQVSVQMYPAIDDPATLANLAAALEHQSAVIVQALEAMGYTNDTGTEGEPPVIPGDLPKPDGWPDDLPWPPQMPPAVPGMFIPTIGISPMTAPATVMQMPDSPPPAPPTR